MPTTANHAIYYPDVNTQISPLASVFAAMANSVDNALSNLENQVQPVTINDSGWTLAGLAVATGFTGLSDSQGRTTAVQGGARKWGPIVELRFRVTKGTGNITATAKGNIADVTVATITNSALRPAGTYYGQFDYGPGLGSGAIRVGTDGTVVMTDFYPDGVIEAGRQIQVDAVYFTG